MANVFDNARKYVFTRESSDEWQGKARYLSGKLRTIQGQGYTLIQRGGNWQLMSNLDNRKKWNVFG